MNNIYQTEKLLTSNDVNKEKEADDIEVLSKEKTVSAKVQSKTTSLSTKQHHKIVRNMEVITMLIETVRVVLEDSERRLRLISSELQL